MLSERFWESGARESFTTESCRQRPHDLPEQTARKPRNRNYGLPILCDFGEARIGLTQESGPFVQPQIYRAPEIIFEMQWGSAVDIWNVACLVRYCPMLTVTDLGSFWRLEFIPPHFWREGKTRSLQASSIDGQPGQVAAEWICEVQRNDWSMFWS